MSTEYPLQEPQPQQPTSELSGDTTNPYMAAAALLEPAVPDETALDVRNAARTVVPTLVGIYSPAVSIAAADVTSQFHRQLTDLERERQAILQASGNSLQKAQEEAGDRLNEIDAAAEAAQRAYGRLAVERSTYNSASKKAASMRTYSDDQGQYEYGHDETQAELAADYQEAEAKRLEALRNFGTLAFLISPAEFRASARTELMKRAARDTPQDK